MSSTLPGNASLAKPGRAAGVQPGSVAAIALGSTAVTWALLYGVMLPAWGGSEWLAALVAAMGLFAAGAIAGRWSGGGLAAGAWTGVAMGLVNLLVMGGLIGDELRALLGQAAAWAGLTLLASTALGMAGAAVTRRRADALSAAAVNWSAALALVTAGATFALLAAGGVVTGREAGMAVRGWLMPEGYPLVLFPLRLMRGDPGVYVEHAHRLLGLLVGLCAIALTVHLWRRGHAARWLAAAILGAVIVQGTLGGTRVTQDSVSLAIVHGVFGQIVFAAMVLVAVLLAPLRGPAVDSAVQPQRERRRAAGLVHGLLLQLVLGATYRHLSGAAEAPKGLVHGALGLHILLAIALVVLAILVGGRASSRGAAWPRVRRGGRILLLLVLAQLALGVAALFAVLAAPREGPEHLWQTLVTTAHQANGALLLSAAVALAAWWRGIARAGAP
jgi:cytochrome c oxidase assembly protein subunit 15